PSAKRLAQEFRLRNIVDDARSDFVPDIEVGATAIQIQAKRIVNIQSPSKTAREVNRFAESVAGLEIESLSESLLHAHRRAVVGRTAVGLSVTDHAEARIQAVQPAVKQISVEAIHIVLLVEVATDRADVSRLDHVVPGERILDGQRPVDRVLRPHIGVRVREFGWYAEQPTLRVQSDSQVRDYRELPGALLRRAQAVD